MIGSRIPLVRLFGFQINIDVSWFLLALLVTWSLAAGLFPDIYADLSTPTYWLMGVAGALGLFLSILLHEIGHAVVARRFGVEMRGITLFIFGGVAEMRSEPPSAVAELSIAIAGPIVSLAIGMVMLAVWFVDDALGLSVPVAGVVAYLGWINLVLVAFNSIPAFPLDGGRVLRAILWHLRGDLRWATRITSGLGGGFGVALIVLGVLGVVSGNVIGGVWWFVLGLFLRGAARMSYQQVVVRRALEGEPVASFMRADPVVVGPDLSLHDLVEQFVYRHQHKLYPVVEDGTLRGCVTVAAVKQVPRDEWASRRVGEVMSECSDENCIHPAADTMQALAKLQRNGISRLMVVEDGELRGVLALKDLMGFLSMKIDLEGE